MQSCTLGSGQLDADAIVKHHGVIAGTDVFSLMRECHTLLIGIEHRQESNVAQVGTPRTTQVQMAEADDYGVAVVIARAPVPAVLTVCRTKLNKAEGYVGTKEHVAVATSTNERIDLRSEECARPKGACYRRDARRVDSDLLPLLRGALSRTKTG